MKILVIGNGGREHAIAWKLSNDHCAPEIFCAPGNAGTAEVGTNLAIPSDDIERLLAWAKEHRPDLTVVGPEAPLCAGIVDRFHDAGLPVFGPSREAAQIEGSKVFSKELMVAAGVPTAASATFSDAAAAQAYVRKGPVPVVVKAEGLAAGKGVYVCATHEEAVTAIDEIMVKKAYGAAGVRVVVEEFLEGEEASILAFVDGNTVVVLASAQDHKRIFNGDQGPNTGGMGTYSPAPIATEALMREVEARVFKPVLKELKARNIVYKGVLYAGLMISPKGVPNVLEFNCRFGDPETQVLLPRMKNDLTPVLQACVDGTLRPDMIEWKPEACVCVVMASGGYPGKYDKGVVIDGLVNIARVENVVVFHAGTKLSGSQVVTDGGRVLGVTARGATLPEAIRRVYLAITQLKFAGSQYRTDIGHRALAGRST